MAMPHLKPCPKCRRNCNGPGMVYRSIKYRSVQCPSCLLEIKADTRDDAAREWNRRSELRWEPPRVAWNG